MKVYLVYACNEHYDGGSTVIRICKDESSAQRFKGQCIAADAKCPQAPDEVVDTAENDKLYEDWWAKRQKWEAKHPARDDHSPNCGYTIQPWVVR